MTLKLARRILSAKLGRKLRNIPANKRLREALAGSHKNKPRCRVRIRVTGIKLRCEGP